MSLLARSDDYSGFRSRRQLAVQDVMTTPVITADRLTPYKEIARLLAEQDQAVGRVGLTAGELMSGPPVVIAPDATIPAAVRAMNRRPGELVPSVVRLIGDIDGVVHVVTS